MSILQRALRQTEYCMVDLETTGLNPAYDGIVEVAAIRFTGSGQVVGEYHSLVNPRMPVGATEIHGITQADVADAPVLRAVAPAVLPLLHGTVVVAFNAGFDLAFLARAWGIQNYPYICAMYFRGLVGLAPARCRLEAACAEHGIAQSAAHTAGDDAHVSRRLFLHYLALAEEQACHTFGDLARRKKYKFTASWTQPLLAAPPVSGTPRAKARYRGH